MPHRRPNQSNVYASGRLGPKRRATVAAPVRPAQLSENFDETVAAIFAVAIARYLSSALFEAWRFFA